jgi:hypothetical protein
MAADRADTTDPNRIDASGVFALKGMEIAVNLALC